MPQLILPFLSFSGKDDDDKLINEQHITAEEGRKEGRFICSIHLGTVRSLYKGFVSQSVVLPTTSLITSQPSRSRRGEVGIGCENFALDIPHF